MKFTCLIYFSFFIMNIFSIQTLIKYSYLKVNEEYVIFESDSFSIGENMFFKISTEENCKDYLYYQYYSDYDDLPSLSLFTPRYYVIQTLYSSVVVKGKITSMTKYFTIEKKKTEIDSSNGKYLLLNYNCTSQYKIENTKSNVTTKIIIIIVIVFCVIIAIVIIITVVVYCCLRKARRKMNRPNRPISHNYAVQAGQYGGQAYYPQSVYPYPCPKMPYKSNDISKSTYL